MAHVKELVEEIACSLSLLREKRPLVHHLTNHVVMADCAAATLNIGGSPVMTLAPEEAEDMVSQAGGLVLNIGTLTSSFVDTMVAAGRKANSEGIPVLLDPVGAGATPMRTAACERILREVRVDIVKGNLGEISVLAGIEAEVRGVDSAGSSSGPAGAAAEFVRRRGVAAAVTGSVDYVASRDGNVFIVKNGDGMLSRLVGTGCMLGSVVSCFSAVMDDCARAACAGLACFGIAARLAAEKASGPASFKALFMDELSALDSEKVLSLADIEIEGGEI